MEEADVIRWAREAGGCDIAMNGWTSWVGTGTTEFLTRFAAAVRAQAAPAGVVTSMVEGGVTWRTFPEDLADGTRLYAGTAQADQTAEINSLRELVKSLQTALTEQMQRNDPPQAAQEPADERAAAYDKIDRHLRNNLGDADYAEYSVALETLWAREQQRPIVAWRIQLKREPNLGWSLHQKEPPIEAQTHFRIEELVVKSGEPRRPMTEDEICQLAAAAGIETEFWNMGAASLVHYHDVQGIPRAEFTAFARLVERRCGITGEPTPLQKLADLSKEMGEGL